MKKRIFPVIFFAIFVLAITWLAYNDLIPKQVKVIPYYDSIGHFVLFGIYAYLADLALKGKTVWFIPVGPGLVILYAVIDEFLQKLSANRTFDLRDLFFGLLGISVAILISRKIKGRSR